jgi:apolipoprotein N-acyltransferase
MIQSAEFASVYGVSFLMAFVGAGAAVAFTGRKWLPLGVGIGAVVLCGVWGQARCANLAQQGQREESPVTIIQGNIPNEAKVNKQRARENIALYERLTSSAVKSRQPSLIVWPETVILLAWSRFPDVQQSLRNNVRAWNAGLVTGSLEQDEQKRLYNVALSLSPRGDVMGVYQKTHLVPFSEYVPMKWFPPFRLLKFLEPEFQAGDAVRLLPTDVGNVGVMICFEAMFPDISRALAQSGAVFLTSMTNDDWSRGTSAPADLAAMSVFRAVETRRWIVRAANTGISCFIDERGRMVARSAWGERETLTQKVVHHAPQTGETFYVRYGNWFIYLCGIVCVTTTAAQFLCRRVEHVRKNERPTGLEQ